MYEGYVRFEAGVEELELPKLTVTPAEPSVTSIDLEAPAGSPLVITVRFSSIATEKEAHECASAAAVDMVDRIAFFLKVSVGDPWQESEGFTPLPGSTAVGGPVMLGQSIALSTTGAFWKKPSPAEMQRLQQTLAAQRQTLPGGRMMSLYRSALKIRNPVDRFLCLYNILLLKHGDSQAAVDTFIRVQESTVAQTQSPIFSNVMETVYTRLRNEFAHIRQGTSFDQTRQEMEQHLGGLKTLAHHVCLIP